VEELKGKCMKCDLWRPPPGFEPGLQAPQAYTALLSICTLPDYADKFLRLYVTAAINFLLFSIDF
jgi:hypothetical protein